VSAVRDRGPGPQQVSAAMRRCWQPVARVEDLVQGPRRAVLLGRALVVFLTASGEPAVLADRCPHRGASLSLGEIHGECVQCPYHGWEWDGGGTCRRVPSLPEPGRIPAAARIESFPAQRRWGLIWTALEEPLEALPGFAWFEPDHWTWGHGEPFELPVSVGVMIENFRDVAHFSFVHQGTLGPVPETVEPLEVSRDGVEVTMRREMPAFAGRPEGWGALPQMTYHAIAPNIASARTASEMGERCLIHAARAISATESAHYWLQGLSGEADPQSLAELIEFEEAVYAEDIPIVSSVEPAELELDRTDLSVPADRFTLAYRRAFGEFVRRTLAGPQPPSTMS
jgi:phenylpropionate dioxygenase-like ring-hydroxylating dioxygenase large terminal subunit